VCVSEVGGRCQLDLNLQNLGNLAVSEVGERCQLDLNVHCGLAASEVGGHCQHDLNPILQHCPVRGWPAVPT